MYFPRQLENGHRECLQNYLGVGFFFMQNMDLDFVT